ncbi:hypothetical protein CES87_19020 [Pseudomonas sp. ERMR1:02]|nr:hypothetical protein CES87_19020 [Pseudomonas sp. ERMR1:02]
MLLNAMLFVGASLLAKVVNDYAGNHVPSGALGFFASRLAPTEKRYMHLYKARRLTPCTSA